MRIDIVWIIVNVTADLSFYLGDLSTSTNNRQIKALVLSLLNIIQTATNCLSLPENDDKCKELIAQSIWAIGNIAGDSLTGIKLVHELNAVVTLINIGKVY
jgi:calcineurin-like phosphoesterase family protein